MIHELSFIDILMGSSFILLSGILSIWMKLDLHKDLGIGLVRLVLQLSLLGAVIGLIFSVDHPLIVLALFVWMVFWAAHTVRGRIKRFKIPTALPIFCAMSTSYMLTMYYANKFIIGLDNPFQAQYFIPMAGMLTGNGMNGVALALERLLSSLKEKKEEVESYLALGATPEEASTVIFRDSLKAGLIPSINTMCATGLVSIPGMMTGQILAGSNPEVAARYQMLIILMIVGSTALTCIVSTWLIRKRCFDACGRLL